MNTNLPAMATTNVVAARLTPAQQRTVERIQQKRQQLITLLTGTARALFLEMEEDRVALQGGLDNPLAWGSEVQIGREGRLVRPVAPDGCRPVGPHAFKAEMIALINSFKD